jgi:hypothetical protein
VKGEKGLSSNMGDGQWSNSGGVAAIARLSPRRDKRWWAREALAEAAQQAAAPKPI